MVWHTNADTDADDSMSAVEIAAETKQPGEALPVPTEAAPGLTAISVAFPSHSS